MSSEKSSLKVLNLDEKKFTGKSGKEYRIELDQISVGRYKIYERKAVELGFGVDFKSIFSTFASIYKAATSGDSTLAALHNITELCHGQMSKMKESTTEHRDEFIFCTLFINTEDEDRSTWDLPLAEAKIEDWSEYDARAFFLLARAGVTGYTNALSHTESLPKSQGAPPKKKAVT